MIHRQKAVNFPVSPTHLFCRVDGAWLGAFRVLFGLTMCVSMIRFLVYGWVSRFFLEPTFFFKYWGFGWVEPLSASGMYALFFMLVALSACVAAGFCFRVASLLFAVGLTYVQLIDVTTYLNHYYLAALLSFLLAVSPAGQVWSVDRFLSQRRLRVGRSQKAQRDPGDQGVALFWLYLLRFQVGAVYFFAGLAKFNSDWLIHAQPLRIWLGARTHLPLIGPLFAIEGVPLLMSWAGFLFDLTIVFWLSRRRTRAVAYLVVLVFHTLTRVLFPIGMFPIIMSLAALVFFEPDWPRRVVRRLRRMRRYVEDWFEARLGRDAGPSSGSAWSRYLPISHRASQDEPRWRKRLLVSAGAVYCVLQLALPLRFLAYGGNVMWHEQGMRFSWRVMLRAKGGSARFVVEEPGSDRRAYVDPRHYLTDLQESEMVSRPDLLLQFAHHLAHEYENRGWKDVAVRVDSRISLNGRRSATFVPPHVDLTSRRDGLWPFDWVAEAPKDPPHHTRPVL